MAQLVLPLQPIEEILIKKKNSIELCHNTCNPASSTCITAQKIRRRKERATPTLSVLHHSTSDIGGQQKDPVVKFPILPQRHLTTQDSTNPRIFSDAFFHFRSETDLAQGGTGYSPGTLGPHCPSLFVDVPHDFGSQFARRSQSSQRHDQITDLDLDALLVCSSAKAVKMNAAGRSHHGRKSTRKTRSGCLTCKRRHVKCDEGKPACIRCMQIYGHCGGYSKDSNAYEKRPILPKTEGYVLSLSRPSVALPFKDNVESLYFRVFQEETSGELAGIFNTSLWKQTVLQECHNEDFIRNALVAIGALSKSFKTDWMAKTGSISTAEGWRRCASNHRQFAFRAYGAALEKMKSIPRTGPRNLRKTLMACLLVFVFETFTGQLDIAFSYASIGDRLSGEILTPTPRAIVKSPNIPPPTPCIVERDLLSAYLRLRLQMMTMSDRRSLATDKTVTIIDSATRSLIPSIFSDLIHAKSHWENIMRRCCHYVSLATVATQSVKLREEFPSILSDRVAEVSAYSDLDSPLHIIPQWVYLVSSDYCADLELWSLAFRPLLDQARLDPKNNTGTLLLRLYVLSTKIIVEEITFLKESCYDKFLNDFHEILALARQISDVSPDHPAFRLDLSIVPPLFIVILRCRDQRLRRLALTILGSSKCQDGPWDRQTMTNIESWIGGEEDKHCVSKDVPERVRVGFSRVMMNIEERNMLLQFIRRTRSYSAAP